MALSSEATAIKQAMAAVIELEKQRQALAAEWQDVLLLEDGAGATATFSWAQQLRKEKRALDKKLAGYQLRNWARIRAAALSERQRRILQMRYVQGYPWQEIRTRLNCSKQYVLREHNHALEELARRGEHKNSPTTEQAG